MQEVQGSIFMQVKQRRQELYLPYSQKMILEVHLQ